MTRCCGILCHIMSNDQPNISNAEVEKFNQMATTWWDPNGPMKPLHQLNPLRLQFIQSHVPLVGKNVLDVGCGAGILTESMAAVGAQATGIDVSSDALTIGKRHAASQDLKIDYQQITIEALAAQSPQSFDVITCMEMLEHVPDPASVIKACHDALKPQGTIFFSTLNRTAIAFIKAIVGAEYILRLLPRGTHEYAKFIKPSELDAWARDANLSLIDLQGMIYHPFSQTFELGKDVSTNYLCCYRKQDD